ncbi:MAG TPA: hypothetical protein VF515_17615 [Candidatus Binatia bacterium]
MAMQTQALARPAPAPRWWTVSGSLVAFCAAVLLASFLKSDPARNDFERFDDLRLLFVFFALFAGLCWVYITVYLRRQPVSCGTLAATTAAAALLLLASFPVGSKDVLGYAFLGRMWGLYHANPYVVAPTKFASDPWQQFLAATLRRPVSAYGPLFLWQCRLINAVGGQSFWLAVWLHKAVAVILLFGTLLVARALLGRTASEDAAPASWLLLLLAWNPLFLFEAASGAHNDIAMVLLLLGALWWWHNNRPYAALAILALSFWYKFYGIIFVPIFLIETLKASGLRAAMRQALVCAAAAVVFGVILLAPLPGALPAIVAGVLHPEKMRGIFPNELSPALAALFWGLRAGGMFATDLGFRIFDLTRFAVLASAVVAILMRQWRAAPGFAALTESCFLTGLVFFFLLITQLWPWHLLGVIAFGVICGREPFLLAAVVLTVLAVLSYFLTFAVATLMLGAVVAALWLLRRSHKAMRQPVAYRQEP